MRRDDIIDGGDEDSDEGQGDNADDDDDDVVVTTVDAAVVVDAAEDSPTCRFATKSDSHTSSTSHPPNWPDNSPFLPYVLATSILGPLQALMRIG